MGGKMKDNYNPFSKCEGMISNLFPIPSSPFPSTQVVRPLPLLSGVQLRPSVVVAGRRCALAQNRILTSRVFKIT